MNGARPGDWVCPSCQKVGLLLGLKLFEQTISSSVLDSCLLRITSLGGPPVSAARPLHQKERGGEEVEQDPASSLVTGPVAAATRSCQSC